MTAKFLPVKTSDNFDLVSGSSKISSLSSSGRSDKRLVAQVARAVPDCLVVARNFQLVDVGGDCWIS